MREPYDVLKSWHACEEALDWIRAHYAAGNPTDWYSLWRACPRGDWMVWLLDDCEVALSLADRVHHAAFAARGGRSTHQAFADWAHARHGWRWDSAREHSVDALVGLDSPHPLLAHALHEGAKLVRRTVAWREVKPLLMEASS